MAIIRQVGHRQAMISGSFQTYPDRQPFKPLSSVLRSDRKGRGVFDPVLIPGTNSIQPFQAFHYLITGDHQVPLSTQQTAPKLLPRLNYDLTPGSNPIHISPNQGKPSNCQLTDILIFEPRLTYRFSCSGGSVSHRRRYLGHELITTLFEDRLKDASRSYSWQT